MDEGRRSEPAPDSPVDLRVEEEDDIAETNGPEENTLDPRTQYFVKKTLHGVTLKSDSSSAKTSMGMFAKVMEEKNLRFMEVEKISLNSSNSSLTKSKS